MTCQYYGCEKIADYPYPACGITHGVKLRDIKKDLIEYQSGTPLSNWYSGYGPGLLSINELEHYSKLI